VVSRDRLCVGFFFFGRCLFFAHCFEWWNARNMSEGIKGLCDTGCVYGLCDTDSSDGEAGVGGGFLEGFGRKRKHRHRERMREIEAKRRRLRMAKESAKERQLRLEARRIRDRRMRAMKRRMATVVGGPKEGKGKYVGCVLQNSPRRICPAK